MIDGVIKGSGNSRYLKTVADALTKYPTYQDFMAALIAGTLPIDLNGINTAGWTTQGTPLNKANLLTDATAALLGGDSSMVPDEALVTLLGLITTGVSDLTALANTKAKFQYGSYTGTGKYGSDNWNSITFSFEPKLVIVQSQTTSTTPILNANNSGTLIALRPIGTFCFDAGGAYPANLTWSGNMLKWWGGSAPIQLNESNKKYSYLAIG